MDVAIITFWCGENTKFYCVQGTSCISSCHICQKFQSLVFNDGPIIAHSPVAVIDCPEDQGADVFVTQWFQFKDNGTGKKSTVYFEVGILGSCTNENNGTVFYKRKKVVLLSFVESVDLINKENCFFAIHTKAVLSLVHYFLHVFFACNGSIDLGKACTGGIGDDFGQGGLTCSRWSVKDNGSEFVSFNSTIQ